VPRRYAPGVIDLRRVQDRWRRFDVTVRDVPIALVLAVFSLLPGLDNYGTQVGGVPARPTDALAIATVALECLPLAVRRRLPVVCLALVSIGFAVDQLRGYHTVAGTALPIALLSAAAHLEHHRRTTMIVASAAYVPLTVALEEYGANEGVTRMGHRVVAAALPGSRGGTPPPRRRDHTRRGTHPHRPRAP
jgi:hypothetical protein